MSKIAFLIIVVFIISVTFLKAGGVIADGWQSTWNTSEQSYADVRMFLKGEGSGEVRFSKDGIWANTSGGAEATAALYVYEPELQVLEEVRPQMHADGTPTPVAQSEDSIALAVVATLLPLLSASTPEPEPWIFVVTGASPYRLRTCPNTDCSIDGHLKPGQEAVIVGRDLTEQWFLVDADLGRTLWVAKGNNSVQSGDTTLEVLPISGQPLASQVLPAIEPTSTPIPLVNLPGESSTEALQEFSYEPVVNEVFTTDHVNTDVVRIYAWIHADGIPSTGISLRTVHDGIQLLPYNQDEYSSLGAQHITWPRPYGDDRQRPWNLKAEFIVPQPSGRWEFTPVIQQLGITNGLPSGKTVTFEVDSADLEDQKLEFYIEYLRN